MSTQSLWRSAKGRAAIGAIIGGPVGVVTALAAQWPLAMLAGLCVAAGGLVGALTGDDEDIAEAAVDAILPVGAWLVGAAIAWVILGSFREEMPPVVQERPLEAALGAAVLGGTVAVLILMARLSVPAE